MGGKTVYMQPPAAAVQDYTPLYAMLAMQQQQQREASADTTAAQKQAVEDAQKQAASQNQTQSNAMAQQFLGKQEAYQKVMDEQAKAAAQQAATSAATSVTGAPIDLAADDAAEMENLSSASGILPSTAANTTYLGLNANPISSNFSRPLANKFSFPQTSGLTFGGGY